MAEPLDTLIVGGGPAGLTAAIYLGRYHLKVRAIDAGESRAEWIPLSHNHAGYPEGIGGRDLVQRMRAQAERYGVYPEHGTVESLTHEDGLFRADTSLGPISARAIFLATGTVNRTPPMPDAEHDAALDKGLIRYCPVCDGYEATDKDIAVLGRDDRGAREALFLRGFSKRVTLIDIAGDPGLDKERSAALADADIPVLCGPATRVAIEGDKIVVDLPGGRRTFDTLYPALGSDVRSKLAADLGVRLLDDGTLDIDDHCRLGIAGFYAAGDVVKGLDQISSAMGQAAIAATAIRNDLNKERPIRR